MAATEELVEKVADEATSATPDFSTDYSDERFAQNDQRYEQQKTEIDHTYNGMIESADKFYEDQKQLTKDWEAKQSQIQQENTDFAIEKIEQQKDQAHKDYLKEQSGAYVDWQKQSNQYGVNAEKMASAGLDKSGYSESSQVSMYNTYQNRVASARESYSRAVLNYDNAIKDAQLQNNAALAEIAYQSLQKQLDLSLQGFQYKNQLVDTLVDRRMQIESERWQREYAIMQQQNWEKQMAEEYRQFEDSQKFTAEQNALDRELQKELKLADQAFEEKMAEIEQNYKIAYLNAQTEKEKELLDKEYALAKQKALDDLENDKALLKYEYDLKNETEKKTAITNHATGSIVNGGTNRISDSIIYKNDGSDGQYKDVDMDSVLSLGMGPISGTTVANLVNAGKAYITNNNGTAVVNKNTKTGWAELPTALLRTGNAAAWKK